MVRIRLPDATEAVLDSAGCPRRWRSDSPRLERLLNCMLAPWPPYAGEDAELREAEVATKVLGAEIVGRD